ncbi:MAG TPA: SUMF1/EgtB/PvdO family nonheme iron enzyme [Chthonomonadaceae bacterium]|nr:SUMF1/EgtB/PvdO family nonheme iron enzyme [Chthonomonadaceae bacterium]
MRASILNTAIAVCLVLQGANAQGQNRQTLSRFAAEPHTGPVEQALLGVTATFRGKSGEVLEVRRGDGMILRCDGFVLFPASILAHRRDEPDDIRPDIQVHLRLDRAPEAHSAPWPVHIPAGVPLRMVKLANVHAPALRTLLPDVLAPGDALTVAWRPWDPARSAFGPLQKRSVHFAGRSPQKSGPTTCLCREPLPDVPAGAVVLGPEELAVGIVAEPGGSAPLEFTSMEALRSVTNCVVPVPTPDADFAAAQETIAADAAAASEPPNGARRPSGMVRIAGGPAALLRSVVNQQDEMQGATVACLPPFDIDRAEVSNAQYWDWWKGLPAKTAADLKFRAGCWPLGWAAQGAPFPEEIRDTPVLGVPFHAAEAFARAHGKRLPTPYEWCLAALGPGGEATPPAWMARYVADRVAAAARIKQDHLKYLADHADDVIAESFIHPTDTSRLVVPVPGRTGIKLQAVPDYRIHKAYFIGNMPWIVYPENSAPSNGAGTLFRLGDRMAMQAFSRGVVDRETNDIWATYKAPMRILPAGSREFDTSVSGVSDMLFNAHEYINAPPFAPHSDEGFTIYVNWVGMASRELADDYLVEQGTEKVATYWPPSRILRAPASPRLARWLQVGLNVREARSLFYLIAGWSFEMGPEPIHETHLVSEALPWTGPLQVAQGEFPIWLNPVWSGKPSRPVKEIGSAADVGGLAAMPAESGVFGFEFATLDVLRPVGFRCAR